MDQNLRSWGKILKKIENLRKLPLEQEKSVKNDFRVKILTNLTLPQKSAHFGLQDL